MASEQDCRPPAAPAKRIVVTKDGPYLVYGDVPLVRKTQVVSERGEPLTWRKGETLKTEGPYALCRCGRSANKPYCDGAHTKAGFDGTESAETSLSAQRQTVYPGGKGIVVKKDRHLCSAAGFCANCAEGIADMVPRTGNTEVRAQVMGIIEHCPSGSLAFAIREGEPNVEPDLPQEIAVVTEITSDGPIDGPLWVSGGIPIERADGKPFETRNRVTLCRCGRSSRKPLCDGIHRYR